MYLACRHIKPGGQRCKSPALRGQTFCYFHARLHSTTQFGFADNFALSVPEDSAAIQESLGRLLNAILCGSIDLKKTAQLLWGLQIASNNLPRKPKLDPMSVLSVTRNKKGLELAPVLRVCNPWLTGDLCDDDSCQACSDYEVLMGRREEDTGDEDAEKDKLAAVKPPRVNEWGEIEVDYQDDDDEDDDNNKEDTQPVRKLRALKSLKQAIEQDE